MMLLNESLDKLSRCESSLHTIVAVLLQLVRSAISPKASPGSKTLATMKLGKF